jgi:hypothetical protein
MEIYDTDTIHISAIITGIIIVLGTGLVLPSNYNYQRPQQGEFVQSIVKPIINPIILSPN